MRILLCSHRFAPDVGGIETMSMILAKEFVRLGHEVRVVTNTPSSEAIELPFEVIRDPGRKELLALVRWSQVVFHNNICMRLVWPLLIVRRPWVVAHHTWITRSDGSVAKLDRLKRFVLRWAKQIAVSKALADDLGGKATVIGNCYDRDLFRLIPGVARDRDFVFVGRLVSDKGPDLAIDAMEALRSQGIEATLTVIGDGEETSALKAQVAAKGLEGSVRFTGSLSGPPLAEELNRQKIMLIPSRWNEPFGIVALEGIACGCAVLGSNGGGLPDAIGPCGTTFPNGHLVALTEQMREMLEDAVTRSRYQAYAETHLNQHTPEIVASKYLAVLEGACR